MLVFLALVPVFAASGLLMIRAQTRYIALYRDHKDPTLVRPQDLGQLAYDAPWRFHAEAVRASSRLWTLVWQRQDDPRLEQTRTAVTRGWQRTVAILFGIMPPAFVGVAIRCALVTDQ
jgi:hypothetical protein